MVDYLRNDPGFDPNGASKRITGGGRGQRFFRFAFITLALGGLVFWGATKWLFSGGEEAQAAMDLRDPKPISAKIDMEEPVVELAPPTPSVEAAPPPPQPRQPVQRERAPSRSGQNRKPELPTQIAWNVQVTGEQPNMDWFANGQRPHLAHGCALRPGASVIRASLDTTVQSEVPGQVIATVTEDLYDPDGEGNLLVPQGTKLVGSYQNDLTLGSRRLGIRWNEATYPNGEQIWLADANGMDVAGSMGTGGKVTTSWGQVIATVAVFSIFDAAQRQTAPDDTWAGALGDSTANQASRVSGQIVKKMLDQAVKIRIEAGTQIIVSVGKTLQVC